MPELTFKKEFLPTDDAFGLTAVREPPVPLGAGLRDQSFRYSGATLCGSGTVSNPFLGGSFRLFPPAVVLGFASSLSQKLKVRWQKVKGVPDLTFLERAGVGAAVLRSHAQWKASY